MELKLPLVLALMRKGNRNPPWWLEAGTEVCPACGHTYVIQTEYRCMGCDAPVCGMCVKDTVVIDFFCQPCAEPATESEK